MALDDILAAIRRESADEIGAIEASAERRVAEILDEARRRAAAEAEGLVEARRDREVARAAALANRARLDADKALRAVRAALVEQAIDDARLRLSGVRAAAGYPELAARLLDEATAVLAEARIVRVDPADEELFHRLLAGGGWTVQPVLETWGGVEVATGDGRVVQNTVESRLDRATPELRRLAVTSIPVLGGALP